MVENDLGWALQAGRRARLADERSLEECPGWEDTRVTFLWQTGWREIDDALRRPWRRGMNFDKYEDIPEDIRVMMRFSGVAIAHTGLLVHFNCARWDVVGNQLYLRNALVNTSECTPAGNLKVRFTMHEEFILGGVWSWTMKQMCTEDR